MKRLLLEMMAAVIVVGGLSTQSAMASSSAPFFSNVSLSPTSVSVGSGVSVTFTVTSSSGWANPNVIATLLGPGGVNFSRIISPDASGNGSGSIVIPQTAPLGIYALNFAGPIDGNGLSPVFSTFPSVNVVSNAQPTPTPTPTTQTPVAQQNSTPPEITSFIISPSILPVSGGTIKVTATIKSISGLVGTPVLSVGTAGSSHSIFDDILPRISGDKFFGIYSRDIDVPAGNIPGTYVAALGPLQDELRNTSSIIYQLKASFQYGAPTPMPTPMPTPTPTPTVQSQFVAQESIAIANLNAELDKVRNSQKVSVIKMKSLLIQLAGEIGTSAFLADFQDTHNTIASFLIHSYPAKKFLLCVKRNSPAGPLLDIVFPKTQKTKCPNGWTM